MNSMSRRIFVAALPLMAVGLASAARAQGNPPANASAMVFQNMRIFDGKGALLSAPSNVPFSPIDVSTFTEAELRAAVEAAENWGTYVTVHAFTPAAIQRTIAADVKCIEHGFLMDEATAELIAEKGVWLSCSLSPRG